MPSGFPVVLIFNAITKQTNLNKLFIGQYRARTQPLWRLVVCRQPPHRLQVEADRPLGYDDIPHGVRLDGAAHAESIMELGRCDQWFIYLRLRSLPPHPPPAVHPKLPMQRGLPIDYALGIKSLIFFASNSQKSAQQASSIFMLLLPTFTLACADIPCSLHASRQSSDLILIPKYLEA